ncbi:MULTISPECIES: YbaB/EbfC family nucleoid-associated protein [unclassified Mycobacterium]|uniref:YbaB/EbfC family nucleoid-associated protein n=1 Tax=unclassified Mycobacterium TaxID=2642494 RepID=UPI0008007A4D|nr:MULTISPECIES: YbaB/EbfC family nucleoid-associated protein [unclassified Mycobacterium]OBG74987.1 DNA-binding protein [Mycobacterium sp. E1214]OBH23949.1 DNA-binding protein [Mycobacterium sp. E1319]
MSNPETHPQVAQTLAEFERFTKALEDQMNRTNTQSFTATDEAETVEVTIDGHRKLTDLRIEDGLLRLGAEEVQDRINEALLKAQAGASDAIQTQQAQLFASLNEIVGSLQNAVSLS